jgi:hypothetical protein
MRRTSKKTAARQRQCKALRKELIAEVGRCEICGHDPQRQLCGSVQWDLCVHEIARGAHRQKALDKRYAVLVLCWACHTMRIHGTEHWPEARQLAVLKRSRPDDYDLAAYNALIGYGQNRITEDDVLAAKER